MQAILELIRASGANPTHERRMLRAWLAGKSIGAPMSVRDQQFPKALIAALPAIEVELAKLIRVVSEHPGEDGSSRSLLALDDGKTVESVLLLREGLCVSSQVGCAVGCVFCMTGRSGLLRQLRSAEILAQVALGRARRSDLRRVVFMGMGEPSHNLDAVLEAITFLGTHGDFGHKNLVFSTVGDRRVFERLIANPVRPALALSLHTTDAAKRAELLPRAPRITAEELIALGDAYSRATSYPVMYQWTLIEGVNDTDAEMERLSELLQGKYAIVNLIPYNAIDDLAWKRPSWERAREMSRFLHQRRVLCKLRRSAGQDVDGGCGQLRARTLVDS